MFDRVVHGMSANTIDGRNSNDVVEPPAKYYVKKSFSGNVGLLF